MSPERWRQVYELFNELLALPPESRRTALEARCSEDSELKDAVTRLLERDSDAEREDFLAPPASTILNGHATVQPLGVQVRCPNCRSAIELVDVLAADEVQCKSCGSTIQLDHPAGVGWGRRLDGAQVSRFRLLEPVGTGAFGTVYKAHDPKLDRLVAVKLLRQGALASNDQVARFLEDARSSARLRHSAIVPVHEVGEHAGIPFIVRDFIAGVTLADWIQSGPPTFNEAARVVAEVADALHHAHENGIIHRDVKSRNILLDAEGRPHLMDFGLAKREAGEITITLEGQVLGTPAYMSPEQARGQGGSVDRRSDVYSLGVVFYEALTRELPFRGNVRMLLDQVVQDEPRPPRRLNDRIPRDLETICLKAMDKEPSRRYLTAADFAADLRRHLAHEPILARPVGPPERAWRWCRRNPRLAGSLGAMAASLLAATVVSFLYAIDRGRRLSDSSRHLALVSYELGRDACERGEVGPGLHWLWRSHQAADDAGDEDLTRVARRSLAAWRRAHPGLKGVYSHDSEVKFVALSPDAKTVLTASSDRTARFWDVATGLPIGSPLAHRGAVWFSAFSPDGKTALTTSLSGEARLWDVATATLRHDLAGHEGEVYQGIFGPGGSTVVTAGQDGTARVWDVQTGRLVRALAGPTRRLTSIALSGDGKTLLAGSDDGNAWLWDAEAGRRRGELLRHPDKVEAVDLSRDGKWALTGCRDHAARLWEVGSGRLVRTLAHDDEVWGVAISPDAATLATCGADRTARLWERASGRPIGEPLRHEDKVWAAEFSPDGRALLTASWDHTARLWDARSGRPIGRPFRHESQVNHATFSPDGKSVLTAGADRVARLWDAGLDEPSEWSLPRSGSITAAGYSPDGKWIAGGSRAGEIFVCDAATGTERGTVVRLDEEVTCLAWSPDGARLAAGGKGGKAGLWNLADSRPIGPLPRFTDRVSSVHFTPDGSSLLLTSGDGTAQILDASSGRVRGETLRHDKWIFSAAISPDGTTAATASLDGKVGLWDLATGRRRREPLPHPDMVLALAFSPDGKKLLTGCKDNLAREWDVATGRVLGVPLTNYGGVFALAYHPRGTMVASGGSAGRAQLWDAAGHSPQGQPLLHQNAIYRIEFSAAGDLVLTASSDGTARIWDSRTGRPIGPPVRHTLGAGGGLADVAASFRPDGLAILTVGSDGEARCWGLAPEPAPNGLQPGWVEPTTGLSLEDGIIRVLDTPTWTARRRVLAGHPALSAPSKTK
jgi:WD40 repeat protein/tRNA A-37 threonylcarbamoyl transferase component Bud32